MGPLVDSCRGRGGFGDRLSGSALATLSAACAASGGFWHAWSGSAAGPRMTAAIGLVAAAVNGTIRSSIPFLLVDPGSRRRGIGTGLVREALMRAESLGSPLVCVETLDSWGETAGFWSTLAATLGGDAGGIRGGRPTGDDRG